MLQKTKRKGRINERKSVKILEGAGYRVTVSAASLGAFDLVGISSTDIVLVQVKSNRWPGAAEFETLHLFPCPPNAKKLIHRWDNYQRQPQVKEIP